MRITSNRTEIFLDTDDLRTLIERGSLEAGTATLLFRPDPSHDLIVSIETENGPRWEYKHQGVKPTGMASSSTSSGSEAGSILDGPAIEKLFSTLVTETRAATIIFEAPPNGKAHIADKSGNGSTSTTVVQWNGEGKVRGVSRSESI